MKSLLLLAFLAATLVGGTPVQAQHQPGLRLMGQLEKTQGEAIIINLKLKKECKTNVH